MQQLDVVIAGMLFDEDKKGNGFSALFIGKKDGATYRYIGLVHAGSTSKVLRHLGEICEARIKSIFSKDPKVNSKTEFKTPLKNASVVWTEPVRCVGKCSELDNYGSLRHPSFVALHLAVLVLRRRAGRIKSMLDASDYC